MEFMVKKGVVKWDGAFYGKGSVFDAERDVMLALVAAGRVEALAREDQPARETEPAIPPELTVREIQQFLKNAESAKEVEHLLSTELAKQEPRKSAVTLLQGWLEANSQGQQLEDDDQSSDELLPPALNADDVIVGGE